MKSKFSTRRDYALPKSFAPKNANPQSSTRVKETPLLEQRKPSAAKKEMSFKEAFASARKAGKDGFTWKGRRYTTELKGGKSKKKKSGEDSVRANPSTPTISSSPLMRNEIKKIDRGSVKKVPFGKRP